MKLLLSLLLLLSPCLAYGQEVSPLRKRVSPEVVATAKDIVKQSEQSPIVMPFGGYALVPMEVVADPFIVPGSDDCLFMQIIPKGKTYSGWMVSKDAPGVYKFITIKADDKLDRVLVSGITQGKQTIIWHAIVDGKSTIIDAKAFQVGDPKPVPPNPPGPNPPGPTPPDPAPPIPGAGFRVLIVTETKDLSTLPSAQVQAMTAKEVTDYLDSHCIVDNGQPEYRRFDKDIDLSKESSVWQDAMNRVLNKDQRHPESKYTSLPWILITNGKTGYEGPLPVNKDALMTLLKQYGGN